MATSYIDATYIDSWIGADVRAALFTTPSAAYDAVALALVIEAASDVVRASAEQAGYTVGDSTSSALLKIATFGIFLQMVPPARKGLTIGDALAEGFSAMATAIAGGTLPIPGLTPSVTGGIGGITWTSSDEDDSTGIAAGTTIPQRMSRLKTLM